LGISGIIFFSFNSDIRTGGGRGAVSCHGCIVGKRGCIQIGNEQTDKWGRKRGGSEFKNLRERKSSPACPVRQ
jgi:hypothetical protein